MGCCGEEKNLEKLRKMTTFDHQQIEASEMTMNKSKDNETEGRGNDEVQMAWTKVKSLSFRTSGGTAFPASLLETQVFERPPATSEQQSDLVSSLHMERVLEAHLGMAQKEKTQLKVDVQGHAFQLARL